MKKLFLFKITYGILISHWQKTLCFSKIQKKSMFLIISWLWLKIYIPWQNLSGKYAPKVSFWSKKWNYSKSNDFARKKSIINHDSIWCQKLLNIIFMSNTHFNFFWELNNMPILAKMFVSYCKTKSQQIQHFNMVHRRDISLAESRGSSRFLST